MAETSSASEIHNYSNREIADLLAGVAARLQILEANRFRVIAFQNASENIRNLTRDVKAYYREDKLDEIPGVGEGIASSLRKVLEQGSDPEFDALFEQVPAGIVELMGVPEMGPKKAKRLWDELGIMSVADLQAAAEAGKLRTLKGFGAKSEERILQGIAIMNTRGDDRIPIGMARPLALAIVRTLQEALPEGTIAKIEIAGSLRRWKETIGDVDILCVSDSPILVMETFRALPDVATILGAGDTKSSVTLHNGMQVDLRVVEPHHWGAALVYFTGSKEHNIPLREWALKRGWSLNEYGLTATGKAGTTEGEERFFSTEEELYAFLDMEYPLPPLRENRGEIEAAKARNLPRVVNVSDIRGEFHSHTTWSDGKFSVAEMAEAARAKGYSYWNVSDHSVGLGIVQGVDAARLQAQRVEIDAANVRYEAEGIDFRVIQGSEVEILADGTLGLTDEVLATLDVVVASIHSAQRQDRDTITERCLKAVRNPHVDILGHPTSRLLGHRPPTELDMEVVLQECLKHGTVVEINANPERLDLNDVYARRAVELGCKIAINCDAHSTQNLDYLEYGIAVAQRGWVKPEDVVNTRSFKDAMALFKDHRKE
jgi:DNA polymerase (family 10)